MQCELPHLPPACEDNRVEEPQNKRQKARDCKQNTARSVRSRQSKVVREFLQTVRSVLALTLAWPHWKAGSGLKGWLWLGGWVAGQH
jgi:hypothetical protein